MTTAPRTRINVPLPLSCACAGGVSLRGQGAAAHVTGGGGRLRLSPGHLKGHARIFPSLNLAYRAREVDSPLHRLLDRKAKGASRMTAVEGGLLVDGHEVEGQRALWSSREDGAEQGDGLEDYHSSGTSTRGGSRAPSRGGRGLRAEAQGTT